MHAHLTGCRRLKIDDEMSVVPWRAEGFFNTLGGYQTSRGRLLRVGQGRDHPFGEELDRLDVDPVGGAEDDVLAADAGVLAEDGDQLVGGPDQGALRRDEVAQPL